MPSLGKARLLMLLHGPCCFLYITLCYFVGAGVFAYFFKLQCDPFQSRILSSPNQLLPFFVKTYYERKAGGQGLFLAVLFSASLSSVSSVLSGCAANVWEDQLRHYFPFVSDTRAAFVNKLLVILLAAFIAVLAVCAAYMPGNLFQILSTIGSSSTAPVAGIFFLAIISRQSEWRGAIVGCVAGFTISAWISFGSLSISNPSSPLPPLDTVGCEEHFTNMSAVSLNGTFSQFLGQLDDSASCPKGIQHIYTISFLWFKPIGIAITFVIGLISSKVISHIDKMDQSAVNKSHVICFTDIFRCDGWSEICHNNRHPITGKTVKLGQTSTEEVLISSLKESR